MLNVARTAVLSLMKVFLFTMASAVIDGAHFICD